MHQNERYSMGQPVKENIKLSKQLLRLIKKKIPTSDFLQIYSVIQQSFTEQTKSRKRKLSIMNVVNPEKKSPTQNQISTT